MCSPTAGRVGVLGLVLGSLGEHQQARRLHNDAFTRSRRVKGEDHPETLSAASLLGLTLGSLGEHQQARQLQNDTLTRLRRVRGDDHPETLTSASRLAADLRELGEYQQARALDEDTLARRRRVLGDDHPDTLDSADNLAADLRAPGEPAENDETPFAGDLPWSRSWSRSPASGNVQHRHPAQVTGGQSGRGNGGMIDDDKRP